MLSDELVSMNPWWASGQPPEEVARAHPREGFTDPDELLEGGRVACLTGLRRAGKTTAMLQMLGALIGRVEPRKLLYAAFNARELRAAGIRAALSEYARLNDVDLGEPGVYAFLDEVQYVGDWALELKDLHDRRLPVRFVVSGSSPALVHRGSAEGLVGRVSLRQLHPFSFREYVGRSSPRMMSLVKGLPRYPLDGLEAALRSHEAALLAHRGELERHLERYLLWGALPQQFESPSLGRWQEWLRQDYVALSLFRDVAEHHGVHESRALEDLVAIVCSRTSDRFSHLSLANALGVKSDTLMRYLSYLEAALLVRESAFFSGSASKAARRSRKLYAADTGLANAVLYRTRLGDDDAAGRLAESAVQHQVVRSLSLHRGGGSPRTAYWEDRGEVDIVAPTAAGPLPIEVKYRRAVEARELGGLASFARSHRCRTGLVVTRDAFGELEVGGARAVLVPAWAMLVMT